MKRPPIPKNENERLAALEALKESETKFRNIVEGSLQGFVIYRGSEALFVNQKCADIFGYDKPEEMLNMSLESMLDSCIPPEEHDRLRGYILARAQGDLDVPDDYECPGLKRDGSPFWFENRVTTISWNNQPAIQIAVVDITERKLTEEALQFTQFAVDNASDCIYWMNPEGGFIYVNNVACESLGYTREELLSLHVYDIDPHVTKDIWQEYWETVKVNKFLHLESQHRTKSGRIIDIDVQANYFNYEGNEYDCAIVRDITERKEAERKLQFTQFAVDHLDHPAYWLNQDAQFIYVNNAACHSLGYTRENY